MDDVQMAAHFGAKHGLEVMVPQTTAPADESTEPECKRSKRTARVVLGALDVNQAPQMGCNGSNDGKTE